MRRRADKMRFNITVSPAMIGCDHISDNEN